MQPSYLFLIIYFLSGFAWAVEPAKLLTVDAANLPAKSWTVGLMQSGYAWDDFYLNTNTIMDLALTGNLGLKYATKINDVWALTAGARYIHFFGESTLENFAKEQNSMIDSVKVKYNGYNAFLGASASQDWGGLHINTQYADVSGSKVLNLISALNLKMGQYWHIVAEAGYDFENKQPRGSLGVLRTGETFSMRLGMTYVEIKDSAVDINLLPIVDFYWNFGGAR